MNVKDLKLHYNRTWQAVCDVHIFSYRYDYLVRDILKRFLPFATTDIRLRIVAIIDGTEHLVHDNDSLYKCLVLGGSEIEMYVDVPTRPIEGNGMFNSSLGYFVEEVDEEGSVIVLDSDIEVDDGFGDNSATEEDDGVEVDNEENGKENGECNGEDIGEDNGGENGEENGPENGENIDNENDAGVEFFTEGNGEDSDIEEYAGVEDFTEGSGEDSDIDEYTRVDDFTDDSEEDLDAEKKIGADGSQ